MMRTILPTAEYEMEMANLERQIDGPAYHFVIRILDETAFAARRYAEQSHQPSDA
jgi:hypothetical protein